MSYCTYVYVLLTSCRCFVNSICFFILHQQPILQTTLFLSPSFLYFHPFLHSPLSLSGFTFLSMAFSLFFSPLITFSVACPPQQFKSGHSNTEACHFCPLNSYANMNGSIVCACSAGYYRTSSETDDAPCTGE